MMCVYVGTSYEFCSSRDLALWEVPFLMRGVKHGKDLGIICSGMLVLSKWEDLD